MRSCARRRCTRSASSSGVMPSTLRDRFTSTTKSAPEQEVRDATPARHLVEVVAVEQLVGRGPEALATAELDRRNRDVHRVDEVGGEELAHRRDATTEAHVLAVRRVLCLPQRLGGRRVEEVKGGVGQRERRPEVVREHEYRRVERRDVAPPPLPVLVL